MHVMYNGALAGVKLGQPWKWLLCFNSPSSAHRTIEIALTLHHHHHHGLLELHYVGGVSDR